MAACLCDGSNWYCLLRLGYDHGVPSLCQLITSKWGKYREGIIGLMTKLRSMAWSLELHDCYNMFVCIGWSWIEQNMGHLQAFYRNSIDEIINWYYSMHIIKWPPRDHHMLAPSIFKLTERSSGPFDPRRFARSSLALLLSFQLPLHGGVTSSASFLSRPRPRFTYPSPGKHRDNQPRSFPCPKQPWWNVQSHIPELESASAIRAVRLGTGLGNSGSEVT